MAHTLLIVSAGFVISFCIHVLLYRFFRTHHISPLLSVFSYSIGLTLLVAATIRGYTPYPATSIILYACAAVLISWFSFGTFLGGDTPASMMLTAYRTKRALTKQELIKLFTVKGLIDKRVRDLMNSGLIRKRNGRLFVNSSGAYAAFLISLYQTIFNRRERG